MFHLKSAILVLALALATTHGKPSHPFGFHAFPDYNDVSPPILPPQQFHSLPLPPPAAPALAAAPPQFLPFGATPALPFAAPPAFPPAPLPTFLHSHFLPAPAPLLPAPLPLTKVLPPVYEALPFATPTYRAIPGPKTTTHSISIGYAFPAATVPVAKLATPHWHAAPLTLTPRHYHHHSLF